MSVSAVFIIATFLLLTPLMRPRAVSDLQQQNARASRAHPRCLASLSSPQLIDLAKFGSTTPDMNTPQTPWPTGLSNARL